MRGQTRLPELGRSHVTRGQVGPEAAAPVDPVGQGGAELPLGLGGPSGDGPPLGHAAGRLGHGAVARVARPGGQPLDPEGAEEPVPLDILHILRLDAMVPDLAGTILGMRAPAPDPSSPAGWRVCSSTWSEACRGSRAAPIPDGGRRSLAAIAQMPAPLVLARRPPS